MKGYVLLELNGINHGYYSSSAYTPCQQQCYRFFVLIISKIEAGVINQGSHG